MSRYLVLFFAAGIALLGVRASAHHSFAATYVEEQSVTIQGELVQFLFRDPHSFVHVVVREKDGTPVRYAVEWVGARQLGMAGVTKETLRAGDFLVITGSPGRNPTDHRVRVTRLHRPKDGFGWGHGDL